MPQKIPHASHPARIFSRHPLALAIALALGLAIQPPGSGIAHAQSSQSGQQHYDLPAGPLDATLTRIARQSGRVATLDPRLMAGLRAGAVKGEFSPEQAFARALAGTGLEMFVTPGGALSVRPAPVADKRGETTLAPMTVTASAERSATTEGSGSYTTRSMATATKLPLSIRETPQAVTVLTRQQMDDQAINSLNDVAQNAPGVFLTFSSGISRPTYNARGFEIETVMYDGFPSAVLAYIPSVQPNLAMYDRVEIVRGATGLVQGAGNPSAGINMVRKRPTRDFQASLTATAGSWENFGLVGDVGGTVNQAGTLRARVVVAGQDANSFRDVEEENRALFYAVGEADLGEKTTLTLGAFRQRDYTNLIWGGLPNAANGDHLALPRSTFIGTDWEYSKSASTGAFATLEHRLDNEWLLRAGLTHTASKVDLLATSVWNNSRYMWAQKMDHTESGLDLNASGPLEWLGRRHELVGGASIRRMDYTTYDYAFQYMNPVDPMNWNPGSTGMPSYAVNPNRQKEVITQKSVYLAGRFSLANPLKLIVGSRLDWYDYSNKDNGSSDYQINRHLTRYAGLLYDLDKHHTLYTSYTDIFRPQTERDTSRKVIEPITGKNYEIGVKGEYFAGALNASLALFKIDQENRARLLDDQSGCPTYPGTSCHEAAGLVRSKGIDLEIQGALTRNWQIGAGYTYSHTKYVEDANPSNVGKTFRTIIPRQLFKLSTLYRLPGDLNQWRIGGNLYQQSRISADSGANWHNEQKAYAILGLLAGYRVSNNLDLQLNINNVFDKTYYRSISGGVWLPYDMYGAPRNFLLTAKYTF